MIIRENVLHYMLQGHVHVSKKDYGFFHNLQKIIAEKGAITTNQNKLFEKLLFKYSRQLIKLDNDPNKLLSLKWNTSIVETQFEFTIARVSYKNNNIHLKCPFNNKFIKNFKNINDNLFTWDKKEKEYVSPFCTNSLKILYNILPKHFNDIEYCDELNQSINVLKAFDGCIFKPTLKNINGNLYIIACNESLYDYIKDIPLEKTPQCFYELSHYGIDIDSNLLDHPTLYFASSIQYECDVTKLEMLADHLEQTNIKAVFFAKRFGHSLSENKKFISYLRDRNIKYMIEENKYGVLSNEETDWINKYNPVLIQHHSSTYINRWLSRLRKGFGKFILLKYYGAIPVL